LRRPNGFDGIEAVFADRKTGNIYERDATEPAIGGEEDGKNAADYGCQWRDEGKTLIAALHSSLSV
jgi:hypothetical protein